MTSLLRLLALFMLVIPTTSPASGQIDTAGGGTVVTVEGSTIKITLNVDLLFEAPSEGLEWSQGFRAYTSGGLAAAAVFWNDALRDIPASECFDIRIEVVPNYIEFGGSAAGGGHDIRVLWDVDPRFDSPQLTSEAANDDTIQVFTTNGTGYFPPWMFDVNDPRDLAHELGHLFGLGDDYTRDADGIAVPLPGREGTLMDGGDRVDQELVDGIVDLVRRSGKQLPECWEGTIELVEDRINPTCTAITMTARFEAVSGGDGAVTGTGTFDHGGYTCEGGYTVSATSGTFELAGRRTEEAFTGLHIPDWSPQNAQTPRFPVVGQMEIPVEAGHGEADVHPTPHLTYHVTLDCLSCEEDAAR